MNMEVPVCLSQKYFKILDSEFGIENFALLADDSSSLIQLSKIPIYYKNCIKAFHEMCKLSRCLLPNELLWYNSRIKFKGKISQESREHVDSMYENHIVII